jgi:hypothetical protein
MGRSMIYVMSDIVKSRSGNIFGNISTLGSISSIPPPYLNRMADMSSGISLRRVAVLIRTHIINIC